MSSRRCHRAKKDKEKETVLNGSKWTKKELDTLLAAIRTHGTVDPEQLVQCVRTRSSHQIQSYLRYLRFAWSKEQPSAPVDGWIWTLAELPGEDTSVHSLRQLALHTALSLTALREQQVAELEHRPDDHSDVYRFLATLANHHLPSAAGQDTARQLVALLHHLAALMRNIDTADHQRWLTQLRLHLHPEDAIQMPIQLAQPPPTSKVPEGIGDLIESLLSPLSNPLQVAAPLLVSPLDVVYDCPAAAALPMLHRALTAHGHQLLQPTPGNVPPDDDDDQFTADYPVSVTTHGVNDERDSPYPNDGRRDNSVTASSTDTHDTAASSIAQTPVVVYDASFRELLNEHSPCGSVSAAGTSGGTTVLVSGTGGGTSMSMSGIRAGTSVPVGRGGSSTSSTNSDNMESPICSKPGQKPRTLPRCVYGKSNRTYSGNAKPGRPSVNGAPDIDAGSLSTGGRTSATHLQHSALGTNGGSPGPSNGSSGVTQRRNAKRKRPSLSGAADVSADWNSSDDGDDDQSDLVLAVNMEAGDAAAMDTGNPSRFVGERASSVPGAGEAGDVRPKSVFQFGRAKSKGGGFKFGVIKSSDS